MAQNQSIPAHKHSLTVRQRDLACGSVVKKRAELLLFLAETLRKEQAPLPEPRQFSTEQLQAWMDDDEAAMRRFKAGK